MNDVGGNNLAGRGATGRYLLLLNPDTVIQENAIGKAVAFADARPEAGIVGGRTFFGDGTLSHNSCHGVPTPWSMFCKVTGLSALLRRWSWFDPEGLGSWPRDTVRAVDAVTGCFLLIRRELWERLGGFDESFFMYGEDTDLCWRAWKAGQQCLICPDARLIHYGGRSEKVRADKMIRLFRAKAQFIQKHWKWHWVGYGVKMLELWALTRSLGTGVLRHVRPSLTASHQAWREIWGRRSEFTRGPQTS